MFSAINEVFSFFVCVCNTMMSRPNKIIPHLFCSIKIALASTGKYDNFDSSAMLLKVPH